MSDHRNKKEFLERHMSKRETAKFKFVSFELIALFGSVWNTKTSKIIRCQASEGKFLGDRFYAHDKWTFLVSGENWCSVVVAKVYQLWRASGFVWESEREMIFIYRVFKHWNQRPNSEQPLLFKVKFIICWIHLYVNC